MVSIRKTVIKWEDPPSIPRRTPAQDRWEGVVAQLREKPGQWALVDIATRSAAQGLVGWINKQKLPFRVEYPEDMSFRFRAASTYDKDTDTHRVYARYEEKED